MDICKKVNSFQKVDDGYILNLDFADLKLYFLTDDIIRIRASFDRSFPEESYVLMTTAWEDRLDNLFEGERKRIEPVEPDFAEDGDKLIFNTALLKLVINKDPFEFVVTDNDGDELYSTQSLSPFVKDSNNRLFSYSRMKEDDSYYGFGEKTGRLNKVMSFVREKGTDCMGYDPEKADTLYKHIPFYIRLDHDSKKAVGVFYHNFYESVFNMGCEKSNYWNRYTYFCADGGDLDLFLISGGSIAKVVDNYTMLTGRPMLLPKRALGYQGSSMYYSELEKDSDDALINFVDTVNEEGLPIDGFHLSSGYTSYEGKRCVFTWNKERFKDPKGYFAAMNEKGAQNVPNVKPGILTIHPWMDKFDEQDVFVKDSRDPSKKAIGKWWGGDGVFWDYTKENARKAWKEYLKENLISVGTNSIWNDNCEYDGLMDKDAVVDFDGKGGTIGQLKPIMATLMCKLSNEAIVENDKNARPYSVCRAGSSGIQRYAQTWCGDNYSSWKTLRANIATILGMGLSGQPNEGADIGGFAGPVPSEELFIRWVEHGIFQARFSIHSASDDNTVTEPWMYTDTKDIIRDLILFRYRMIPYLYSAEYEASISGAPIMRPLVYEFQEDRAVYSEDTEFMFGRDILVANVIEEGAKKRKVYLPKGIKWYDFNDNYKEYEGGQTIETDVDIESVPMFIRQGAIIPFADDQPMNLSRDQVKDLHIYMVPGKDTQYTLYNDDGVSNDYRSGKYKKTNISMHGKEIVDVDFAFEGDFEDTIDFVTVEMVKKEKCPVNVHISMNNSDKELTHFFNLEKFEEAKSGWYYNMATRAVLVKYDNPKQDYTLKVSFEVFDVVGM